MHRPRSLFPAVWLLVITALAASAAFAEDIGEVGDLVYIQNITVAPSSRSEPALLTRAGTIDTDGYAMMVLSLAFESQQPIATGGAVGALLIPDYGIFDRLKDTLGIYGFPLEVTIRVQPGDHQIQIGEQLRVPVAFPKYQVLMYNETESTARMFLYAYRTRCGD